MVQVESYKILINSVVCICCNLIMMGYVGTSYEIFLFYSTVCDIDLVSETKIWQNGSYSKGYQIGKK